MWTSLLLACHPPPAPVDSEPSTCPEPPVEPCGPLRFGLEEEGIVSESEAWCGLCDEGVPAFEGGRVVATDADSVTVEGPTSCIRYSPLVDVVGVSQVEAGEPLGTLAGCELYTRVAIEGCETAVDPVAWFHRECTVPASGERALEVTDIRAANASRVLVGRARADKGLRRVELWVGDELLDSRVFGEDTLQASVSLRASADKLPAVGELVLTDRYGDTLSVLVDLEVVACTDGDGDQVGTGPDCGVEDCDDTDATIGPFAKELCDGIDQDCDGVIDELCGTPTRLWVGGTDWDVLGVGRLWALDVADGSVDLDLEVVEEIWSVVAIDGLLYAASRDADTLHALDLDEMALQQSGKVCTGPEALAAVEGGLLVQCDDGVQKLSLEDWSAAPFADGGTPVRFPERPEDLYLLGAHDIRRVDARTGEVEATSAPIDGRLPSLALDAEGGRLFVVRGKVDDIEEVGVLVFDALDLTQQATWTVSSAFGPYAVAWDATYQQLLVVTEGALVVRDGEGRPLETVELPSTNYTGVVVHPEGVAVLGDKGVTWLEPGSLELRWHRAFGAALSAVVVP